MDNIYNNDLIFGKNNLQNIVSIEPGNDNNCILFVQYDDEIKKVKVDMSHWILYTEKHSDKMVELKGNQPYKYLMQYDNIYKYQDILKQSRDKKLDVYVPKDPKEAFMMLNGYTYYKGLKVKDVSILSFDLEHTYGIGEIPKQDGKLLLISNTYRDYKGNIKKRLFSYDEFKNEGEMLEEWCKFVRDCDPSIIVGHNIFGHDFKILRHSAKVNKSKLKLGRNNSELKFDYKKSLKRKDGSQAYDYFNVLCYGREIVDTFFLALNYDIGRNYESYGLKAIMKHEKLEKIDRTHYDASKIITNYSIEEEWLKIKEYAKDDADDSLALFDLMIAPFFYATQSIPRSLQYIINSASGSQINSMMIRGYLQQGYSISKASEGQEFEGAISFGIKGIHRNVLRFDVSSLYPSIIRQYKIYNKDKDDQALFLKMVEYFTMERLNNKRLGKETGNRYYKDIEQSQKILINSMYGFLGANRINYNYPFGAAEVTRYGREILCKAILWATGKEFDKTLINNEVEDVA
jgi:DNA polymerase I